MCIHEYLKDDIHIYMYMYVYTCTRVCRSKYAYIHIEICMFQAMQKFMRILETCFG